MPVNFRCRSNSNRTDRQPRMIGIATMLPAALLAAAYTSTGPDPAPGTRSDAADIEQLRTQSLDFGSCQG